LVFVKVAKGGSQIQFNTIQTITNPTTPVPPTHSATIALDASGTRIWNVNADANTVTCCDAVGLTKLFEVPVGTHPRNLAVAPDGTIYVAGRADDTVMAVDG
jgi:YVTN family beta-propeller protein